ncbi:hypothetical protein CYG48_05085 [Neorhizobium sp. SOG26]|uniref:hypothetical protein n=1 Tax=Neorhizobium sp. SOG26 TaxID=2060726 RepID=UPI000E582BF8|nr:hypothetical protein [Neorhizobium sp. SOG26]AXV15128.1 hypothetical protein CYG48_05085 [Neorhizobium sp. SOG26]
MHDKLDTPDRETLLSLCDDYMARYDLTPEQALGVSPPEPTIDPAADALALAVREYLLEMDRQKLSLHFGEAKVRFEKMHQAVTDYYVSRNGLVLPS